MTKHHISITQLYTFIWHHFCSEEEEDEASGEAAPESGPSVPPGFSPEDLARRVEPAADEEEVMVVMEGSIPEPDPTAQPKVEL